MQSNLQALRETLDTLGVPYRVLSGAEAHFLGMYHVLRIEAGEGATDHFCDLGFSPGGTFIGHRCGNLHGDD